MAGQTAGNVLNVPSRHAPGTRSGGSFLAVRGGDRHVLHSVGTSFISHGLCGSRGFSVYTYIGVGRSCGRRCE